MKVLLSCVGKQDPISEKTQEEGAIVSLARRIMPHIIYLFPTGDGPNVKSNTEEEARETKKWLESLVDCKIKTLIRPLYLDPTNYNSLLAELRKHILRVKEEHANEKAEYFVNISSGTPQMTAAFLVLGTQSILADLTFWQVANPQEVDEETRIRQINTSFLEEENTIARIKNYINKGYFKLASEESDTLQKISAHSTRREKAALMKKIFLAYEYWDLIQWKDAHTILREIIVEYKGCEDLKEILHILEQQAAYLDRIISNKDHIESPENLIDLYFNAKRCFDRKAYTDTLARFWRLVEGIVYWILRNKYGIEPTCLSKSRNAEQAQIIYAKYQNNKFNLSKAMRFLEENKPNDFLTAMEHKIQLQRFLTPLSEIAEKLRKKRNDSIVAHGMRPVTREEGEAALAVMKRLLIELLPDGRTAFENYPFTRKNISKMFLIV